VISSTLVHPRGVLLVTSAFFIALALAALLFGALPADDATRDTLLALASPPVIAVMRIVNHMGDWRALVPGTLLLFVVFPRARERWWIWVVLMITAPLVEGSLKYLVGRSRPENLSYGFPSGHSTAAAAFFGAVIYLAGSLPDPACRWVRALAPVGILLVGLARVILRAHWPSDVLGGIALGLALASAAALLEARRRPQPT
jgi:membrane-associated phospholipid phosphatase